MWKKIHDSSREKASSDTWSKLWLFPSSQLTSAQCTRQLFQKDYKHAKGQDLVLKKLFVPNKTDINSSLSFSQQACACENWGRRNKQKLKLCWKINWKRWRNNGKNSQFDKKNNSTFTVYEKKNIVNETPAFAGRCVCYFLIYCA